jgi:hypothetical protein
MMFSIELELQSYDAKWLSRYLTENCPVQYIIGYLSNITREFLCRNSFFYFWKWSLIIRPIISLSESFFSCERVFIHIECMIISEVAILRRKELSPFSITYRFFYNPRNDFFILLFRILLIQDTVFCISESYTAETIMNIVDTIH